MKHSCISKLDRCYDRKICKNQTLETPVTSSYVSVECLELKTDRISNKLFHTESAAR
jgi:hypothetical protein